MATLTVNANPGRVAQSAASDSDWLTLSIPSRIAGIPIPSSFVNAWELGKVTRARLRGTARAVMCLPTCKPEWHPMSVGRGRQDAD
jgi:hypothetical protein